MTATANTCPLVIKIGGAALQDLTQLSHLFHSISELSTQRPCVLVHGGGALIDSWLQTFQRPTLKHQGLRVTQQEDMPIVAGALAGALNLNLVAHINATAKAPQAVGVTLADLHWCKLAEDAQRGAVGIPQPALTQADYVLSLLTQNITPVIASVGMFADGQLANVNADQAAAAVAGALQAELLLLTDVDAVLDHQGRVLRHLNTQQAKQLIAEGTVKGGMRVKLEAALHATELSRRSTAVAAWYSQAALTAHLNGQATATQIVA